MTALVLLGALLGALALPPTRRRRAARAVEQAARPDTDPVTAATDAAARMAARLREEQP